MEALEEIPHHSGGIYNYFQGATIHNLVINGNMNKSGSEHYHEKDSSDKRPKVSKEQIARAIENSQEYFWGKASYAVVFCVCRDDYKMPPNMSAFEREVESLPYHKSRDYACKTGTITNAFSDNSIYYSHIDKWEEEGADERQIKLRDVLRMNLTED